MAAAIQQYDGFVEKFVGDAVMAIFGAPTAHEDDPERALCAALAMQEGMAGLNGRWQARLGKALALQGLLLSRVDRLPPPARRALHEAAVLGTDFDERLLRQVVSEPEAADASLNVLCEAELLHASAERHYRFSHALVQEVVYQNLLLRRRTELHGRAGLALEVLTGGRPERLEDLEALGHHFCRSADKTKGARYLVAAGDWARAIYANEDALRLFRLPAFELGEVSGWPQRATPEEFGAVRINPTGELAAALQPMEANDELNRREGFQLTEVDQQIVAAHGTQLVGHFLIDREGIIRWTHIEAWERMTDLGKFPTEADILPAARSLPRRRR